MAGKTDSALDDDGDAGPGDNYSAHNLTPRVRRADRSIGSFRPGLRRSCRIFGSPSVLPSTPLRTSLSRSGIPYTDPLRRPLGLGSVNRRSPCEIPSHFPPSPAVLLSHYKTRPALRDSGLLARSSFSRKCPSSQPPWGAYCSQHGPYHDPLWLLLHVSCVFETPKVSLAF
ncbi:hypothetical protein VTI74DRAFT_7848 [Chaetomium olivicolor]